MKLWISPHSDDEVLWGSFTLIRHKPLVAIFTDKRNAERNVESIEALKILGIKNYVFIDKSLDELVGDYEVVFAPAMQDGHWFHNKVCQMAIEKFGPKVKFYSTYTKDKELPPIGRFKVESNADMLNKKLLALDCFKSQHKESAVHFNLECKDEYYF